MSDLFSKFTEAAASSQLAMAFLGGRRVLPGHYIIAMLDEETGEVAWYDALPASEPIPDGWVLVGSDGMAMRSGGVFIGWMVPWADSYSTEMLVRLPAAAGPLYQPRWWREPRNGLPMPLTQFDFATAFAVLTAGDNLIWED